MQTDTKEDPHGNAEAEMGVMLPWMPDCWEAPEPGRAKTRFFLESLVGGAWSCWPLEFGLLASRTMRRKFLLF